MKSQLQKSWNSFRTAYPNRPFCLLQPRGRLSPDLFMPDNFMKDSNTIYAKVHRDPMTSHWFDICNLEMLRPTGVTEVSLFLDTSETMVTSQGTSAVQASFDQFMNVLDDHGMILENLSQSQIEDWITPHMKDNSED